MIKIDTHRIQ